MYCSTKYANMTRMDWSEIITTGNIDLSLCEISAVGLIIWKILEIWKLL